MTILLIILLKHNLFYRSRVALEGSFLHEKDNKMVIIKNNNKDRIIDIYDNAGYAEKGSDIVCVAVTALTGTLERYIQEHAEGNCT